MKKSVKFLLVAVLAVFAIEANAQLGVKLGYSNLSQRAKSNGVVVKPGALNGINLGVFYDIALPVSGLSIRPGLGYTYGGCEIAEFMGTSAKQREHFLNIPVDVKYTYRINNNFRVYAFAGPKFAIGLASTFVATSDGDKGVYNNYTGKMKMNGDAVDTGDEEGSFSRFDIGLGLGAGVQYGRAFFEFGYDWGLLNRYKGDLADNATYKMSQLFVGVGLMF